MSVPQISCKSKWKGNSNGKKLSVYVDEIDSKGSIMAENFYKLFLELVEANKAHESYRDKECINLIASEGLKSPAVRQALSLAQDLESRYAEGENDLRGHVKTRYYQGQRYITTIENCSIDLVKELFGCGWADLRPISGTIANIATFKGLSVTTKNNKMAALPLSSGAHVSHDYSGAAGKLLGLEIINLIHDIDKMNIDPDKSATIIRAARPGIVTVGGSLILFPYPLEELRDAAEEVGAYVVYDAAHPLGLIAGGKFQDPLREGADFVTASTHKTFPGPQGGLVLANPGSERMEMGIKNVQRSIFPAATSNTHLGRLPATAIATLEMKVYGKELAEQTIRNAQHAGECLFENGIRVLGEKYGFTRSHQIAIDVRAYGGGKEVVERLEAANIITNKNLLPIDDQGNRENPSGLRLGFQDITRRGLKESNIEYLCELMGDVIKNKRNPLEVREDVIALIRRFRHVKYGFGSIEEAVQYIKSKKHF
jgi:glycine hydroxymethyltransferase